MSKLEDELLFHVKAVGLPAPVREYRFAGIEVGLGPGIRQRLAEANLKDWRFDFCWPDLKFAVEVEGVVWSGKGRHQTGKGMEDDLDKYDAAMKRGWTIYRCSQRLINNGKAIETINRVYGLHRSKIPEGMTY